jgi:hypothetical protein
MWQRLSATIQRRPALQAVRQQAGEKLFVAKMTILFDKQHSFCEAKITQLNEVMQGTFCERKSASTGL